MSERKNELKMNVWKKEWIKDEWLEERMNKGWMGERKNKLKMNNWKKDE